MIEWFLATAIGAILYRLGGWEKGNRMYRIIGCPLVAFIYLVSLFGIIILPLICCVIMGVAISTYHYWLKKPTDYSWYHYAMHGFFVSASIIIFEHWYMYAIRVVLCALLCGLGYKLFNKRDWLNELIRGAILIGTIPLLIV